ncbi:hypothetical protein B5M09_005972 [Aphanomyces astaci]|uniref:Uncharacterized protein n=1 Tax=Aphanomyces astaci TaxID=112090 RepID=A0A425DCX9_APHAT|nr:hypothetical protein B5M09_005972 [Aphanomyces astaci]
MPHPSTNKNCQKRYEDLEALFESFFERSVSQKYLEHFTGFRVEITVSSFTFLGAVGAFQREFDKLFNFVKVIKYPVFKYLSNIESSIRHMRTIGPARGRFEHLAKDVFKVPLAFVAQEMGMTSHLCQNYLSRHVTFDNESKVWSWYLDHGHSAPENVGLLDAPVQDEQGAADLAEFRSLYTDEMQELLLDIFLNVYAKCVKSKGSKVYKARDKATGRFSDTNVSLFGLSLRIAEMHKSSWRDTFCSKKKDRLRGLSKDDKCIELRRMVMDRNGVHRSAEVKAECDVRVAVATQPILEGSNVPLFDSDTVSRQVYYTVFSQENVEGDRNRVLNSVSNHSFFNFPRIFDVKCRANSVPRPKQEEAALFDVLCPRTSERKAMVQLRMTTRKKIAIPWADILRVAAMNVAAAVWKEFHRVAWAQVVARVHLEDILPATKMNSAATAVDMAGVLQVAILLAMKTTIDVQWRAILGPATVKVVVGVRPEDTLQATKMNAVVPLWEDFLRSPTAVDTTGVLQVSILLVMKTTIDVQWRAILGPATVKVVAGVHPEDILQATKMNAVVPLWEDFLRSVTAVDTTGVLQVSILLATKTTIDVQWRAILRPATAKVVAGVRPEDILQARTMNAVVPLREDFLRSVGAKIDILRVGRAAIVVAIQWKDILQMPTETSP